MKLIDILVEELPQRGGWPDDSDEMSQSHFDCEIYTESKFLPDFYVGERAEDNGIDNGVTREQYEAALAAKNEGWIEWGGGECPVSDSTIVEVRYRNGEVKAAAPADFYEWGHGRPHFVTTGRDIIAYRLHKTTKSEQVRADAWNAYAGITKADGEADLNECIGQNSAPIWNGEGLPPVGCECECQFRGEWQKCTILFSGKQIVVVMVGDDEYPFESKGSLFRPIRSEVERKRDDICDKIYGAMTNAKRKDNRSDMAEEIYDAIAAGKIPGVKLDD